MAFHLTPVSDFFSPEFRTEINNHVNKYITLQNSPHDTSHIAPVFV